MKNINRGMQCLINAKNIFLWLHKSMFLIIWTTIKALLYLSIWEDLYIFDGMQYWVNFFFLKVKHN